MKLRQHYAKAPITEALIDFKVEFPGDIAMLTLRETQRIVESDYPLVEEMFFATGQFQAGPVVTATATQVPVGYRFLSSDKKRIFQARNDGFTFSQLKPYQAWRSLSDEAHRLWKAYNSVTQPKKIRRVAVRYINRLDLPCDSSGYLDFKDYLRTVPEVSPDLSQGLSDYLMQLQIPQEDLQAFLILNEAILPAEKRDFVSVLLDIDLFGLVDFAPDSNEVWGLLEEFRNRKNNVFEACITDNTRKLFE